MPALARLLERGTPAPVEPDPKPVPEPEPIDDETDCICTPFGADGQNPACHEHPWWRHDTAVLDLADLTRELGSALAAAKANFGGSA